jgi:hypothetical protein
VPIASELQPLGELTLKLSNLTLDFLVREFGTVGCEFERHKDHAAHASRGS